MLHPRRWLLVIGVSLWTGCGTGAAPGLSQTQPTLAVSATSAASGTAGQAREAVDVCALMPLGDVQALSPFTRPLVTATADAGVGGCWNVSPIPNIGTSIALVVEGLGSPSEAVAALRQTGQDFAGLGTPPEVLPGVGDEAFGIPRPEEASIWASAGNYVVCAILKGEWEEADVPDVPLTAKYAAGSQLLKQVIARLP